jgi:hypothetical protein
MIKLLEGLCIATVLLGAWGCETPQEVDLFEAVKIVPLPDHIGSFKVADQIGTDVHKDILALIENEPQKYTREDVDFQINWGKMEDMSTGESIFYIKVIGKSPVPVEQNPAALDLMQFAIERVHQEIQAHGQKPPAQVVL